MSVVNQFATVLRSLRESAQLSQAQLAEKIGVSRGSISYYENGERTPDIDFLEKVSRHFCVSYDYLLGKTPFKNEKERSSLEKTLEHLPEEMRNEIMYVCSSLAQCAETYKTASLDSSPFFPLLISDVQTFVSAYKEIPLDFTRYDGLTIVRRYLDRIVHTNTPDTIYHISRLSPDGLEGEANKGGLNGLD